MSEIRGIGLDLCEISRMEKELANEHFLKRILTEQEQAYLSSRGRMAASSLAGIWAAKEAALKAFSVGITVPVTDVEIMHLPSGQPVYALHGEALRLSGGGRLLLTITHENGMAAAVCVWTV